MRELRASRRIAASAEAVFDLVSDVTRMGEWSPENLGGQWLDSATQAVVGARFKGRNKRKASWSTTAVVTEADRGRAFAFAVGRKAPEHAGTRWRYTLTPLGAEECEVTETCEIVREPGFVARVFTKLGTGVTWAERPADLVKGMEQTLERLAARAEATA